MPPQPKNVTTGAQQQQRTLLVLHGSRQVGTLLVGRMDKLRKRLHKNGMIKLVAPDGPFPHADDAEMRQWWNRNDNTYEGLEESLDLIQSTWQSSHKPEGILGFSQGARLAHLLVQCHESTEHALNLDGLSYVIMCAGYDAPLPSNLKESLQTSAKASSSLLETPSLHVYGTADKLIPYTSSQAVTKQYANAQVHEHDGGHHVPMRAANVAAYQAFIEQHFDKQSRKCPETVPSKREVSKTPTRPNEENAQAQQDEVEALSAIFPEEFTLLSKKKSDDEYDFPISYKVDLVMSDEGIWPPHPLCLKVTYPSNYPTDTVADVSFLHDNNMMEFGSAQIQVCMDAMKEAAEAELGMPSVMTTMYAARNFFESGSMANVQSIATLQSKDSEDEDKEEGEDIPDPQASSNLIKPASEERIRNCNLEGLEIARALLKQACEPNVIKQEQAPVASRGGTWKFTVGLVGKPSAGKSTFFNAATAFARQKDDTDNVLGGATMAPHPFTTIDPNVGFCLVPAPDGSCPEDGLSEDKRQSVGCTHGRDHLKRRLIPVLLKDVAGLVPGAYQGRGRGNKFLNDLTDADVLIHVVDASGTADTEGNALGTDDVSGASSPLNDLAWILNELVEWVYNNVLYKWESIQRRGRNKLFGMFGGYGQSQSALHDIFTAIERYMAEHEGRDRSLDNLQDWDEGDLHRLVSAFLGCRFPMALALNKRDLDSAKLFIHQVQDSLPVHGAYVGVPLSARAEMSFVRQHIAPCNDSNDKPVARPERVWQCLQSAIMLKEPLLVFPVSDMVTYSPLPAMFRFATQDASLPNPGMIACLQASGGEAPSLWNENQYLTTPGSDRTSNNEDSHQLRDVLVMKPNSTVEDVFLALKRLGALGGEFVRAEGAGNVGEKAKLVPKHEVVTKATRILKIMTNKRREWQSK